MIHERTWLSLLLSIHLLRVCVSHPSPSFPVTCLFPAVPGQGVKASVSLVPWGLWIESPCLTRHIMKTRNKFAVTEIWRFVCCSSWQLNYMDTLRLCSHPWMHSLPHSFLHTNSFFPRFPGLLVHCSSYCRPGGVICMVCFYILWGYCVSCIQT